MSRSLMKRAFGSLRRMLRGKRAPTPREQEWLRLILLVRRLQHGQLAVVQRLDEIRTLTTALGSFRSELEAMHEQLVAARLSAGELERGLSERVQRLDGLADPGAERALLDRRLAALDVLAARLETLAGQAPAGGSAGQLEDVLARFEGLATRIENAQAAERAVGGQDELAHLYERILELAEGLAHRPPPVDLSDSAFAREAGARLASMSVQLDRLGETVQELSETTSAKAHGETLAQIERLATRLERRSAGPGAAKELTALLNRFDRIAGRLEQQPAAPPLASDGASAPDAETARALEELRVAVLCEQESRRRVEGDLEGAREKLRASELARVELDTRHTAELAQMADHVGRQLQRVEEDLKKKKRGMAELTQQNIELQNQLVRLQGGAVPGAGLEPPPALPRGGLGRVSPPAQPGDPGGHSREP